MQVEVTREAARRILHHGGQLFLWQELVGEAWAKDEIGFSAPEDFEFRRHYDGGVEILVAEDLRIRHVRVEPRSWPWRGLKVYVEGKRWGRRGRVSGEHGLSYGGAGPP